MHPIQCGDGEYAIGREPRAVEPSAGGAGARGDEGDEEEWVVVAANGSKTASFPGTSPHSSSRGHPRTVLLGDISVQFFGIIPQLSSEYRVSEGDLAQFYCCIAVPHWTGVAAVDLKKDVYATIRQYPNMHLADAPARAQFLAWLSVRLPGL
jgi:hypothetical protein